MIIDTTSGDSLRQSVSESLNISISEIEKVLRAVDKASRKERYFDCDFFNDRMSEFIDSCNATMLDMISLYHLSRRLNDDMDFGSSNLFELLVTDNSITRFLQRHGFAFEGVEGHVEFSYKNEKNIFPEFSMKPEINYLKLRLGYYPKRTDFCINGFTVRETLLKNDYARWLDDGPEFIVKLAEFVDDYTIIDDFKQRSTYYCFRYDVPFTRVVFDEADSLLEGDKVNYFLKKCLLRMLEDMKNDRATIRDLTNPIVRLMDNDNIMMLSLVGKEIITEEMLYSI